MNVVPHTETENETVLPVAAIAGIPVAQRDEKMLEEINQLRHENAKVKSANDSLLRQAESNAGMSEKYKALESQYKALVAVKAYGGKMEKKISKTKGDEKIMKKEENRLEKEIDNWPEEWHETKESQVILNNIDIDKPPWTYTSVNPSCRHSRRCSCVIVPKEEQLAD